VKRRVTGESRERNKGRDDRDDRDKKDCHASRVPGRNSIPPFKPIIDIASRQI
jgi:hypothetical protein